MKILDLGNSLVPTVDQKIIPTLSNREDRALCEVEGGAKRRTK